LLLQSEHRVVLRVAAFLTQTSEYGFLR